MTDNYTIKRIAGKKRMDKFIERNGDVLKFLCGFNINDDPEIEQVSFFVCENKTEIVGVAVVKSNYLISQVNDKLITYNSISYIFKDNNNFRNNRVKKDYRRIDKTIDPCIISICKNKNHKGVGRLLLGKIEKHYKKQGYSNIYVSVKSNDYINDLDNLHYEMGNSSKISDFEKLNKKIEKSNNSLIDYYVKNGYSISKYYYDGMIMPLGAEQSYPYGLFFNIMIKGLTSES